MKEGRAERRVPGRERRKGKGWGRVALSPVLHSRHFTHLTFHAILRGSQ